MEILNHAMIVGATWWFWGTVLLFAVIAGAVLVADIAREERMPVPLVWVIFVSVSLPVGIVLFSIAHHLWREYGLLSPRPPPETPWRLALIPLLVLLAVATMIIASLLHFLVANPPPRSG